MYHDANRKFPCESFGTSFYLAILPYVDQQNQVPAITANGPKDAKPVALFLCPSRRGVEVGPRTDYAGAVDPTWLQKPGGHEPILCGARRSPTIPNWNFYARSGFVTLPMVGNCDGTSNTLLLAHKAVRPRDYTISAVDPATGWGLNAAGDKEEPGWAVPVLLGAGPTTQDYTYDHFRCGFGFGRDSNDINELIELNCKPPGFVSLWGRQMSSPHATMISLVADASVKNLAFNTDGNRLRSFWYYNDGVNAQLE
jgi:hypothetical protein